MNLVPQTKKAWILSVVIAAALLFVAAGLYYAAGFWKADGKIAMPVDSSSVKTLDVPDFKQKDPRWADKRIGGSDQKISKVGCTLCSVAMVMAYYGEDVDPVSLNEYLINNDGYTFRGWLKWYSAAEYAKGRVEVDYLGAPSHELIEKSLKKGRPSIVKILLRGVIPHWVVIVGKDKGEYLVMDPLGESAGPVPLSEIADTIYSLRIYKPAEKNNPS